MKKLLIIVFIVVVVGGGLTLSVALSRRPPPPGTATYRRWDSYDEAKSFMGEPYLYPVFPDQIQFQYFNVYAFCLEEYIGHAEKDSLPPDCFYGFCIRAATAVTEDDIQFDMHFLAMDISTPEGKSRHQSGLTYYDPVNNPQWSNANRYIETISGVDVSYSSVPLKARTIFTINNIDYILLFVSTENIYELNLSDEETGRYDETIKQWLDFMTRSIIEQEEK